LVAAQKVFSIGSWSELLAGWKFHTIWKKTLSLDPKLKHRNLYGQTHMFLMSVTFSHISY